MKPHLQVIHGGARKVSRWQWRLVTVFEWIADVHWVVYPLLVVAFFWWLAYGHR